MITQKVVCVCVGMCINIFPKNMKSKRGMKQLDWHSFICPITHALPTEPVVAEDGKVYEKQAWKQYVKITKPFKSPWTRKKICKTAYFSLSVKQMLEQAVRDGYVPADLSDPWKQKLKEEKDFAKLIKDSVKKSDLLMILGDHYYDGTGGATQDLEAAFDTFKKGYSLTEDTSLSMNFFVKMMILNAIRPKRTRTDVICTWTSLCQVKDSNLAAYTIKKVLDHLSSFAHGHHIAEMCDLSFDFKKDVNIWDISSSDDTKANACAKEIANFLKMNAKGHHDSSEEEEDEQEEDEEDDDDSSDDGSDSSDSSGEDDSDY